MSVIKDITNGILNDKPLLEWSHSENNYYKHLEKMWWDVFQTLQVSDP